MRLMRLILFMIIGGTRYFILSVVSLCETLEETCCFIFSERFSSLKPEVGT